MSGRFYSDELNATYELEPAGNSLVLHRPRADADTLRAIDHRTLRGKGLTLRFATSPDSRVAFTADNGRARGLEFARSPK
jgi:hypothetical protein